MKPPTLEQLDRAMCIADVSDQAAAIIHDERVARDAAEAERRPAAFVVGQVWASDASDSRWRVETVYPDGRAVLRSTRSNWCSTRAITMAEWMCEPGWSIARTLAAACPACDLPDCVCDAAGYAAGKSARDAEDAADLDRCSREAGPL